MLFKSSKLYFASGLVLATTAAFAAPIIMPSDTPCDSVDVISRDPGNPNSVGVITPGRTSGGVPVSGAGAVAGAIAASPRVNVGGVNIPLTAINGLGPQVAAGLTNSNGVAGSMARGPGGASVLPGAVSGGSAYVSPGGMAMNSGLQVAGTGATIGASANMVGAQLAYTGNAIGNQAASMGRNVASGLNARSPQYGSTGYPADTSYGASYGTSYGTSYGSAAYGYPSSGGYYDTGADIGTSSVGAASGSTSGSTSGTGAEAPSAANNYGIAIGSDPKSTDNSGNSATNANSAGMTPQEIANQMALGNETPMISPLESALASQMASGDGLGLGDTHLKIGAADDGDSSNSDQLGSS